MLLLGFEISWQSPLSLSYSSAGWRHLYLSYGLFGELNEIKYVRKCYGMQCTAFRHFSDSFCHSHSVFCSNVLVIVDELRIIKIICHQETLKVSLWRYKIGAEFFVFLFHWRINTKKRLTNFSIVSQVLGLKIP